MNRLLILYLLLIILHFDNCTPLINKKENQPQEINNGLIIYVFGQNRFCIGAESSIRIIVISQNGRYIENAKVNLVIESQNYKKELFNGYTDKNGTVGAIFTIPLINSGEYLLAIKAESIEYKSSEILRKKIILADSDSDVCYKSSSSISSSLVHPPSSLVNIECSLDRPYYKPDSKIYLLVKAKYPSGESVVNGKVSIRVLNERNKEIDEIEGTTDINGIFTSVLTANKYLSEISPEKDSENLILKCVIVDTMDKWERVYKSLIISTHSIIIKAIPESENIVPGIENNIFILTYYPDYTPAVCELSLINNFSSSMRDERIKIETDSNGIAKIKVIPDNFSFEFTIVAKDSLGNKENKTIELFSKETNNYLLLRTESDNRKRDLISQLYNQYSLNDTINIEVLSTIKRSKIFLDFMKNRKVVRFETIKLENGVGRYSLSVSDLQLDSSDTLSINAYTILDNGQVVMDTRNIYITQTPNPESRIQNPESRVSYTLLSNSYKDKIDITRYRYEILKRAIEKYKDKEDRYPPGSSWIYKLKSEKLITDDALFYDGWGRKFYYERRGNLGEDYVLFSIGPDGKIYSDDDLPRGVK